MAVVPGLEELSLHDLPAHLQEYEIAFGSFAKDESRDVVSLSEREERVLALCDQLDELKLENALLVADEQRAPENSQTLSDEDLQALIKTVEEECLEARAKYFLRQSVVASVMATDPLLKAVHSGTNGTLAERALNPLLCRRDVLSIAQTNLSMSLKSTLDDLATEASENIQLSQENQDQTAVLLNLTDRLQVQRIEDIADPELRTQLQTLREDTKTSRGRWRVMKSVVGAVIAGSGVDWAHDDDLRDLVLDDDTGPS